MTDYFKSPSTRKTGQRLQGRFARDIPKRPVVKPDPITKTTISFQALRKISPGGLAKGAGTFFVGTAIELALQSLIDMGMDGINKSRLKNKIENLLKKVS